MANQLTLHPTAAAAAQALSEGEGGALVAGDSARGFFAFALEMARKVRPFRLPDPVQSLTLAWEAAQQASMELPIAAAPAFARALSNLHGSGLTGAELRRLGASKLAAALEAHQRLLSRMGLCDPSAVAWLAAEAEAGASAAGIDAIEVLPRIGWTQGELAWMAALGKRSQLTIFLPEDAERPELFASLDAVHQELAGAENVRLAMPGAGWGGLLAAAHRTPAASPPGSVEAHSFAGSVEAHSFGSAADEARAVAVQVRALLRSGVVPDAIAVTSLREPAPEILSALAAAGIPVRASRRTLTATPAGQVSLLVLAAAEEGIPRERLCELLEAGLLPVYRRQQWARLLREAGSGSHARGRLLPPLEALLQRKPNLDRDGFAALEGAVAMITALPVRGSVSAHARALWRTLDELGILERLDPRPPEKSAPPEEKPQARKSGDVMHPRQLSFFEVAPAAASDAGRRQASGVHLERPGFEPPWVEVARSERRMALDQVRELFDSLAKLDVSGRSIDLADFAALVRDALETMPARAVPPLGGVVAVAPAEVLIGRSFSHVFITGLAGDGPPAQEDSFIPESLRRAARELTERPAVLPPAGALAARAQERMALALATGIARHWLWGSGSRARQGKQLEPSPLLAEIGKAAAAKIQVHPLYPWPAAGQGALSRDELCAALPDAPAVREAEPERAEFHRGLGLQRVARERAILEGRIDAFGGDLTAPDVRAGLATRLAFGDAKPLSATTLERLAGCGFRALADVVLGLREPDEMDEALDSRRRGTFVHACLERAFTKLKAAGLLPLRGAERDAEEREVFLAGVREELAEREASGEIGHPVVWGGQRRAIERQLLRLLEAEQRSTTGFVPDAFEVKFGVDRPVQRLKVEGSEIVLGGTADRIDRGAAGSLRVVDYKTGRIDIKNRRLTREFDGRDLQLGHYSLILKLEQPAISVEANYFSIYQAKLSKSLADVCRSAGVDVETFLDGSPEGRAQARAAEQSNLPNLIEDHLRRARAGEFPVQPGDCDFCRFAAGCRVGGLFEEWE